MKRLCGFVVLLSFVWIVVSCEGLTPTSAVEHLAKCIQTGNYDKAAENLAASPGVDTLRIIRDKQQFVSYLKEKAERQFAKNGGIAHYRVRGEAVTPDESKAYVRVSYKFNNGASIDEIVPLVKSGGKWKYVLQ